MKHKKECGPGRIGWNTELDARKKDKEIN